MIKKRTCAAILALTMLLACGCSGDGLPEIKAVEGAVTTNWGEIPIQDGVLVNTGTMLYCFHASTKEFTPLCTQNHCTHEPYSYGLGECPGAELAYEGYDFVVYEDALWFLTDGGSSGYLWRANTDGSDPERIGSLYCGGSYYEYPILRKYSSFGGTIFAHDGYLYTTELNFPIATLQESNPEPVTRLVSIRMRDGRVTPLTEWKPMLDAEQECVGAYGDMLYVLETAANDRGKARFCRMSLTGEEREELFSADYMRVVSREGSRMLVHLYGEGSYIFDMATEEMIEVEYSAELIKGNKLIGTDYSEEGYRGYVYDIETGEIQTGEVFQTDYMMVAAVGDGYVVGNGNQFGYISEKDFLAGKEVELK